MVTRINGLESGIKEKPLLDRTTVPKHLAVTPTAEVTPIADMLDIAVNGAGTDVDPEVIQKDIVSDLLIGLECKFPDVRERTFKKLDFYLELVKYTNETPLKKTLCEIRDLYEKERGK